MKLIFQHQTLNIVNSLYAIITDVDIHTQNPILEEIKKSTLESVLKYSENEVATNNISIGYKELLKLFGKEDLVPAGQNFIEIVRKRGKFPTINTAVDAYNIVVAKSYLAIGAHDLDKINGDIVFDFAKEGEVIPAVNMQDAFKVDKGDYVYRDNGKILAWLDVKDSDIVKLTKSTKNIIFIVEGNLRTSQDYIFEHLKKACELVTQFCGGKYEIFSVISGMPISNKN